MHAKCACIELALRQLQQIIMDNPESTVHLWHDGPTRLTIELVLGTCEISFMALNEKLHGLIKDAADDHGKMTRLARLQNMMKEQEMRDLFVSIEGLVTGVDFLVNTMSL